MAFYFDFHRPSPSSKTSFDTSFFMISIWYLAIRIPIFILSNNITEFYQFLVLGNSNRQSHFGYLVKRLCRPFHICLCAFVYSNILQIRSEVWAAGNWLSWCLAHIGQHSSSYRLRLHKWFDTVALCKFEIISPFVCIRCTSEQRKLIAFNSISVAIPGLIFLLIGLVATKVQPIVVVLLFTFIDIFFAPSAGGFYKVNQI